MEEASSSRHSIRCMVVDDDTTCLKIIATMLTSLNFLVQPFKSTAEALSSLREQDHRIDLFLIEVHAGEASSAGSTTLASFDLVDLIVNQTDIPVITMCANDDDKIICESLRHGARFHFTKPVTKAVAEVMRQKAMQGKTEHGIARSNQADLEGIHIEYCDSINVEDGKGKLGLEFYGVVAPRRTVRCTGNSDVETGEGSEKPQRRRSGRLTWDSDLRQRFSSAVELLGQHAVPRKILELMNVDGITIKQIASHLQKHRKTHQGRLSQPVKLRKRKLEKKSSVSSQKPTLKPLLPKYPPSMLCALPTPVHIHGGMQRPDQQMVIGNAVEWSDFDVRRDELQSRGTGEVASKGSSSSAAVHENSEGLDIGNFDLDEDLIAEIAEEIEMYLGIPPP
ncbi:two-component response regulator ARR10-like [Zingiber officinale]|uniref:Response regulatory domain-containing protein n=1 Tax=Zingiber officinale TaxID=94328 RepID=A0A8J5G3I5_ZINOF|nr:two-component response regulator ARR10-like [Zingiber officinale]KAG6500358.1 hypothetical protein ZIOFF_040203 [Zingiber officinale]